MASESMVKVGKEQFVVQKNFSLVEWSHSKDRWAQEYKIPSHFSELSATVDN